MLPIDPSLSQRRPGDSLEFPQPVQLGLKDPFVLDEHLEDLSHARFRFDQMFQSESQAETFQRSDLPADRVHLLKDPETEEEAILGNEAGQLKPDFFTLADQSGEIDMGRHILCADPLEGTAMARAEAIAERLRQKIAAARAEKEHLAQQIRREFQELDE